MTRAREQEGFVLVSAVILLTVIMGLGLGLLLFADNQQKASAREQQSEQAFNMAEAALNAQVGQLARVWPTKRATESETETLYPRRCTEANSNTTNFCPASIPLSVGYGKLSHVTCPAGTPTEAWGSPLTNQWTTYVRSTKPSSTYFNSKAEETEPDYSTEKAGENQENEKLWVRAVGVVNCHLVSLVTLVTRQLISIPFPRDVVTGNWFMVTNKGKKVIVNAAGEPPAAQPGEISVGREVSACPEGNCEQWEPKKKQIEPYIKAPPTPSPLLSESQLAAVKSLAESKGTLRSPALGNCPTTLEQLSGSPAYIEGCGNLQMTANGTANSAASPGFLVLAEGTLTLKGTSTFYGVIYARNPTNSSGAAVILGGTTTVYGGIDVDGNGGIELGSSKVNLVYEPKAAIELRGSAGATPTRNTFRVLPVNQ